MPLTKYTASTAIIAALADLPNATSGLTPAELKAKFDENPEAFKVFVNSTLTAEIDALIASVAAGTGLSNGAVTNAKLALNAVTSDKIVDGTIVNADINVAAAIDGSKLANLSITSSQIADGAIVNADINVSAAIDATKIGTGVVSNTEFSYLDGVTQPIQTQINGVVLGSIPDGSLTDVKLSANPADIKARFTTHLAEYTQHVPYGGTTTGSANAHVATLTPALASYVAGVGLSVKLGFTNTGASTINVNGLGVKNILNSKGAALTAGKLTLNSIVTLRYNGTAFILQGEGGEYGTAVATDVLTGKTIGTDAGLVTGNISTYIGVNQLGTQLGAGAEGIIYITPPQGYFEGSQVYIQDADYIASKIVAPNNIFGLQGTAIEGKKFASGTGTTPTNGSIVVTGLAFQPTNIIVECKNAGAAQWYRVSYHAISNFPSPTYYTNMQIGGSGAIVTNFAITASGFSITIINQAAAVEYRYSVWGA